MSEVDIDKWDREQERIIVDSLIQAISTAMGIDQLLWKDLIDALKPIIAKLRPNPERCDKCGLLMTYLDWALAQGICEACADKIMAETEAN